LTTYLAFGALVLVVAVAFEASRRYITRPTWRILAMTGALVIAGAVMWTLQTQPEVLFSDFKKAYYTAGEIIRDDADLLYGEEPLLFVNIPIVAWLFAPFSYLSADAAGWVMTLIGLAAILGAYALFVHIGRLELPGALLLAAAFVLCGPLYYSVREGNTTHMLLFALAAMLWCLSKGWYSGGGTLLAAVAIIKPPLGLVVLPFLIRGRWPFVASFAATSLAVIGLSLLFYGIDLHRDWYDYAVRPYSEHPLGAENVQSLDGVMARLYTADYIDDFSPIEELGRGFWLLRTAIAAALLAVAIYALWRGRGVEGLDAEWADASIALCLALLLAPTSWTHYYLLLLFPLAFCVMQWQQGGWTAARAGTVLVAAFLISPPVVYVAPEAPILEWLVPRVLISHYFYGGLLLLGVLLAWRWRAEASEPAPLGDARISAVHSPTLN
jgi:hypothetical protein